MMDYLGDIEVILFGLKPQFRGQKEWFKKILGPVLRIYCCYYSWLPWSDPKPFVLSLFCCYYGWLPWSDIHIKGFFP
jgi:hypothetical protein